eukprot:CAMPEP_0170480582 /NCGR_PEP_ID=MMETSP0208-20121228/1368_1 /TAXON_ID=197538 /ORGANISM="Strombidium inclinatum, Strain S3" /LENGTH=284 /DNA_ID=CAMNT_0010753155 /DNA_START=9 /DNA_END=859 /DNA_ORIENTATION=+
MDPSMFVNMVIRPPKNEYPEPNMGKTYDNTWGGKVYTIDSFWVPNAKGEKLSCSFVEPKDDKDRSGESMPCVIYMHGNAGNKTEGFEYAEGLLSKGMNLCVFDFSGCGNSEGQWVTLGHKEKDDLKVIVEYIYEHKRVSSIAFWGRSMGAVTSLLYLAENPGTANCMVLDSAFNNLDDVVVQLATQMGIPPEFVEMLKPQLEMAIQQQAGFKLADLQTGPAAAQCEVPVMFVHGSDDEFIVPAHSEKNMAAYGGPTKSMKTCAGDHNAPRSADVVKAAIEFLKA